MDHDLPADTERGDLVPDTRPRRPTTGPNAPRTQGHLGVNRPPLCAVDSAPPAATLDDRQAAAQAKSAHSIFAMTLPERFATWLRERAAAHGQTPEHHAAGLIRAAWQTDEWRLRRSATLTEPGAGAGSFRR